MRQLLIVALLAQIWVGRAQSYWSHQYDCYRHYEFYYGVQQFPDDSTLLLAGGCGIPWQFFFVTRINSNGDTIFSKPIDFGDSIAVSSVGLVKVDSLTSIIGGPGYIKNDIGGYEHQQIFARIKNKNAEVIWLRQFGEQGYSDNARQFIKTQDGGFALIGETFIQVFGNYGHIVLLKVDSSGNQVFRKTYTTDPAKDHIGYRLCKTNDGGYLLMGFTKKYETYPCDTFFETDARHHVLIRVDSLGNELWQKVYQPDPTDCYLSGFLGTEILPLPNGNFIMCGFKDYDYPGYYTGFYFVAMLSENGDFISYKQPENISHYTGSAGRMIPTSDGNYLMVGYERDSSLYGQTGLLMKVSPQGDLIWKREYRDSPPESKIHDAFFDVIEMPDKGFVACGRAYGPLADSTYQNGWVIRVDSLGCLVPGCDTIISTAVEPPILEETNWKIYPNPTSDAVTVELNDGEYALGYRLFSTEGKVMDDMQFLSAARINRFSIHLGGRAAGVYLLAVRVSDGSWRTGRIVLTN